MGNSAKRDARKIERAHRQRRVLELREGGKNHEQIAEELGLANKSVAWKLFHSALVAVIKEPAEHVLALELRRLDALLAGCWEKAKAGDPAAIDRVLRIMDRRSTYLGLDQPKGLKVEMARELGTFLERLKDAVDTDVYERVLAVAAGVDGPPSPVGATSVEDPESEEDGDEPGDP